MTPLIPKPSSRPPGRRRRILQNVRRLGPSPGMAVAIVALFVALGGTAVARDGSTKVLRVRTLTVVRVSELVQPGSGTAKAALCPLRYQATGGGAWHVHDFTRPDSWEVVEVGPVSSAQDIGGSFTQPGRFDAPRGWGAIMRNLGSAEGRFAVSVVCAKTS